MPIPFWLIVFFIGIFAVINIVASTIMYVSLTDAPKWIKKSYYISVALIFIYFTVMSIYSMEKEEVATEQSKPL
jgi:hypothetical protein